MGGCGGFISFRITTMDRDEIRHTIDFQLKQPIAMCIRGKYYRAALILIYSGMDAMSNLIRNLKKRENNRDDFVEWVRGYLHIQGEHQTQITPEEWWSSRCGLIHTQTYLSRDVSNGKCRIITFMNGLENPTIRYNKSIDPSQINVSIIALEESFLIGVDKTINALQNNAALASVAEERLRKLYINVPITRTK